VAVIAFVQAGGNLFVSGMDVAFDLSANGSDADEAFLQGVLHSGYVADDAGAHSVVPAAGSIFDGLGTISLDDGTHGTYDVFSPDKIAAVGSATASLLYPDAVAAGMQYDSAERTVFMGFPFEAIYPVSQRNAVMDRVLDLISTNPCRVTTVFGDFDGDWDVDQIDFGHMQACLTGSSQPLSDPACCNTRRDGDSDVDQSDVAAFLGCLSGPGATADPDCDN
jgi:hypothetical protein